MNYVILIFLFAVGLLDVTIRAYIKRMLDDVGHYRMDIGRYNMIKGIVFINFVLYLILFVIIFKFNTEFVYRTFLIIEYLVYVSAISCMGLWVRNMAVVFMDLKKEDPLFCSKDTLEAEKKYLMALNMQLIVTCVELTGLFIITALYLLQNLLK